MPRKPSKPRVPRTRNAGTMTEAQFWAMIRSLLRAKSMQWRPPRERGKRLRRPNQSPNKRLTWEYPCEHCGGWFPEEQIEYDHAVPCGRLSSWEELGPWAERLFVELDGWLLLCSECHAAKTARDVETIREADKGDSDGKATDRKLFQT